MRPFKLQKSTLGQLGWPVKQLSHADGSGPLQSLKKMQSPSLVALFELGMKVK